MKYLSVILYMGLLPFLTYSQPNETEARYIHVLKILDTNSPNPTIKEACKIVSRQIDNEASAIAQNLDIESDNIYTYNATGANFTKRYLTNVINQDMSYCLGDIVLVAYLGHGFRTTDNLTNLPQLYMGNYEESIHFQDVIHNIAMKKPSIIFSIVNACHTKVDARDIVSYPPPVFFLPQKAPESIKPFPASQRKTNRYKELFPSRLNGSRQELRSALTITLLSSKEGNYTYLTKDGGLFFPAVLNTLHKHLSQANPTNWNLVANEIKEKTQQQASRLNVIQEPATYIDYYLFPVEDYLSWNAKKAEKQEKRSMKKQHRNQLQALRTQHKSEMKKFRLLNERARDQKLKRQSRRILASKQRTAFLQMKKRQRKELNRIAQDYTAK